MLPRLTRTLIRSLSLCLLMSGVGLKGWQLLAEPAETVRVPVVTVAGSINPGTGDYLADQIHKAESAKAPYLVIRLDTPGGLLQTTRQIVQKMLNAKVPIVVFVGPRGAQAGSAGALITFAADVAAMAPGTNIGAAHPVSGDGQKIDETMAAKLANDTAAFAESLARAKGRNADWAIQAVKKSASIPSTEALDKGVIDLVAEDLNDLFQKLPGYPLKAHKGAITELPRGQVLPTMMEPTLKQKVVAFLADPQLAYLIMALGTMGIWLELSHPGLLFPGIVGIICIVISLVSFQMLPIDYGALALILIGMAMLIAELFVPAFGLLGIGGLVCFIFGSLFLMDTNVPEFRISLSLILPTAAGLAAFALGLAWVVWRSRRARVRSGLESMLGEFGEVRDPVSDAHGLVFVRGELWSAVSADGKEIPKGSVVVVREVKNLRLIVSPQS